jgi:hypothetical protein
MQEIKDLNISGNSALEYIFDKAYIAGWYKGNAQAMVDFRNNE